MKHIAYVKMALAFLVALFCLEGCKETDDTVDEFPDWQKKNEAFIAAKYQAAKSAIAQGDNSWKIFKSYTRSDASEQGETTDYIVVKVINEGTGSGSPLYTDTVRVHYKGQMIASTTHVDSEDRELGLVFDKSWSTDTFDEDIFVPAKFGVSGVVDGFSTALQHMHIGDRWKVYIPYQLGYYAAERTDVPAYSTLVFDLTLAAYYRVGVKVPTWKSNQYFLWEEKD